MTLLDWRNYMGWLGLEVLLAIGLAELAHAIWRPANGRRTLWQAAFVLLAVTLGIQMTGLQLAQPETLPNTELSAFPSHPAPVLSSVSSIGPAMAEHANRSVSPTVVWPGWIWIMGFLLLLTRLALQQARLILFRRQALPAEGIETAMVRALEPTFGLRQVHCEVWPQLLAPVSFGMLRPTIALPMDFATRFSGAEQQAMLSHELAHLAARDPVWALLADTAVALLWWHPAAWWARRRLDAMTEEAADEASAILPDGPCVLAECLVRIGREMTQFSASPMLGIGGNGSHSRLARRVKRLLNPAQRWLPVPAKIRWLIQGSAVGLALLCAALSTQMGLSGSLLVLLASTTPALAVEGAAATNSDRLPAPVRAAIVATNQIVTIKVQLVSVTKGSSEEKTLEKMFGAPEASPAETTRAVLHDWDLVRQYIANGTLTPPSLRDMFTNVGIYTSSNTNLENITVDSYSTSAGSSVMEAAKFRSLLSLLKTESAGDILSAPTVRLALGTQAHVFTGESIQVVSGVKIKNISDATNGSVNFFTIPLQLGNEVDVQPRLNPAGAIQLFTVTTVTTFVDYNSPEASRYAMPGVTIPWPHFRKVEAINSSAMMEGQTMALRGPDWPETTEKKGGWFSHAKLQTREKRLYVFLTPEF